MVSLMGEHVAKHFHANRPGLSPAVPVKRLDLAVTAERFREHLGTASATFGQCCTGLRLCAMGAIELSWNLEVRSRKPDPLTTHIVHVRENRSYVADLAGRLRRPCVGIKMLDESLVYAIVNCEYSRRRTAELRGDDRFTCGHDSLLLALIVLLEIGRS